ncbi:MAG: hypothetical protein IKC09_09695 [Oscillospiraceae bacterium]|nr:hypothetical protein [Oscillospiraceae bacterium]
MLKNTSSKINAVAAVLALVAVILAFVSHSMTEANALINLGTVIAAGVAAVVLLVATVVVKNDIVGLVGVLGAIACNMVVLNFTVSERILMIAGIFSYDSANVDGWNVFYVVVASAVCVVLSCVATMVGSFMKEKN